MNFVLFQKLFNTEFVLNLNETHTSYVRLTQSTNTVIDCLIFQGITPKFWRLKLRSILQQITITSPFWNLTTSKTVNSSVTEFGNLCQNTRRYTNFNFENYCC